jgi:hypothetical protein
MKKIRLSICVLVLASLFGALTPKMFGQDDPTYPFPTGPDTVISIEK